MKNLKIVADNKIPFLQGAFESCANIIYCPGAEINASIVKDADALITRTRTKCNESLLSGSSVKFIATATIGYDHIDAEFCREAGIKWTSAPGCNSSSVEQYILSALFDLSLQKNILLENLCLGVVGVGMVGSKVAASAARIGMRVLKNDPPRQRREKTADFVSIEEIQREADIISFHVPLIKEGSDKTLNLIDKSFIARLKPGSILINTSRGPIANEEALKEGVGTCRISTLILDVWQNEPAIDTELLHLTTIGTPHIAGYSTDGKAKGTEMSVRAVSTFFNLGMNDWSPGELPLPEKPTISLDCTSLERQEILQEIFLHTYNIRNDQDNLKKLPEKFEYFRNNYSVRREAVAFSVQLINNPFPELSGLLEKFGFSVLKNNCF